MQEENKHKVSRLTKAGFICIEKKSGEVVCINGKPASFKSREDAEAFLLEKNISADIK